MGILARTCDGGDLELICLKRGVGEDSMKKGVLVRIRQAIDKGRYQFTDHAIDEASADGLLLEEVVEILLNGALDSVYTDDPRGPRYVVRGDIDDDEVDVVCRFRADGSLLIVITVYIVD